MQRVELHRKSGKKNFLFAIIPIVSDSRFFSQLFYLFYNL